MKGIHGILIAEAGSFGEGVFGLRVYGGIFMGGDGLHKCFNFIIF